MPPIAAAAASGSFGSALGQGIFSKAANQLVEGTIGQLFGGWNARRQWKYQKKQMALQQKYALEQMAEQSRLQREMFDYENDYNSPVNVFNRYRQAGINPAAVLGSSGASLSATMPIPGAPSGGHVSGGPAIGAGTPGSPADAVAASQIRYNNAAAENQQSSANLSDEKSVTEQSVRNMLAATVDEKVQNTYFTQQRAIYQELVNAKTPQVLNAQISQLTAHADQLVASGNLSEAQIELVREQTANVFFDSQLKKAQENTQSELGKYYASQTGFVSLQAQDLRRNIDALKSSSTLETVKMVNGQAVKMQYKIDGYQAKSLAVKFGAMLGAADATTGAIRADWENAAQWNKAIDIYWDNVNGSISSVADIIRSLSPLSVGSVTTTTVVDKNGEVKGGSETVRRPYRP